MDKHPTSNAPTSEPLMVDDARSASTRRLFTLIGVASAAFWGGVGLLLFA